MIINAGRKNARNIMRRAGYKPWRNPMTGQESYIRRTGASFYPRFHILLKQDKEQNLLIDLHFDKRKPMHKKGVRSYEDKESLVVQDEASRIQRLI